MSDPGEGPAPPSPPPSAAGALTRLASRAAIAVVGGGIGRVLGLAAAILVFRNLPAKDNGALQIALNSGALLALIAELGLRGYVLRAVPAIIHDQAALARLLSSVLAIRFAAIAILLGLLVAAMLLLPTAENSRPTLLLLLATAYWCLDGTAILQKFAFRGAGDTTPDLVATFAGKAAMLALTLLALWLWPHPLGVATAFAAGAALEVLLLQVWLTRRFGPGIPAAARLADMPALLAASFPFFTMLAIATVHGRVGLATLDLGATLSWPWPLTEGILWAKIQAEAYAAACRIPEALLFIPVTISSLLVPSLALKSARPEDRERMANFSMRAMTAAALALSVSMVAFAPEISRVMGGGKFADHLLTFQLMGAWTFLMVLQSATLNLLTAANATGHIVVRLAISLAVNFAVCLYAIPRIGAPAIAAGLLAGDTVGLIYDLHRLRLTGLFTNSGFRSAALNAACAAAIVAGYPVALQIAPEIAVALPMAAAIFIVVTMAKELPAILHRATKILQTRAAKS